MAKTAATAASADLPPIQHIDELDNAALFLSAHLHASFAGAAVAFFSSPDTVEHSVFLTVAQELRRATAFVPALARANVGSNVKGHEIRGCTVYLTPAATALWHNGSVAEKPLLTYTLRLPKSPEDSGLLAHWRSVRHRAPPSSGASTGPAGPGGDAPPSSSQERRQLWERILETEALGLHTFLQRGAMGDAAELTRGSAAPVASAADGIGLLVIPTGLGPAMRSYHIRRLSSLAASRTRLRCDAGAEQERWLRRPRCGTAGALSSLRFVHANNTAELSALLALELSVLPSSLPPAAMAAERAPGFVLFQRARRAEGQGGAGDSTWTARPLRDTFTWDAVRSHVERWAPASQGSEPGQTRP